MNNPLWDYSLDRYARQGVAELCLALQDDSDLDVNMLLYGAWLASMDQRLNPDHLHGLEQTVLPWRQQVVHPLRELRRQWRSIEAAGELRRRLGELELQAERAQQDQMLSYYHDAPALLIAAAEVRDNLLLVAHCCGNDAAGTGQRITRLAGLLQA